MRQLYLSTVASKMDYAAPVWFKSQDKGTQIHKTYDMVQRIRGRVITGAFKSTAGGDLEVEAGLLPTSTRLNTRVMSFATNLHTLPQDHPFWEEKKKHRSNIKRYVSPLMQMLRKFEEPIQGPYNTPMETIQAFGQRPGTRDTTLEFVIHEDRKEAMNRLPPTATLFTDGSVRKGVVGIGVAWKRAPETRSSQYERERARTLPRDWNVISETVARQRDSNEYVAELLAIHKAFKILVEEPVLPREVTICTDCQAAVLSIQRPHQQSGQYVIQAILQAANQLQDRGIKVKLY